jgi:hypothetical protein
MSTQPTPERVAEIRDFQEIARQEFGPDGVDKEKCDLLAHIDAPEAKLSRSAGISVIRERMTTGYYCTPENNEPFYALEHLLAHIDSLNAENQRVQAENATFRAQCVELREALGKLGSVSVCRVANGTLAVCSAFQREENSHG